MHSNGKLIGRGAALALAAAVFATASACSSPPNSTPGAVQAVAVGLTSVDLRSVLVPISEQPETRMVQGPMTVRQAAENGGLVSPPNVVFSPRACETYLADALGQPLSDLNGWVQYGTRVHETHNDNFMQMAVNIPTGADQQLVDRVRAALAPCASGSVTLAGEVTGTVTYAVRTGPSLPGAVNYSVTGTTRFSTTPGTAAAELVRNFEMPPGASLSISSDQSCVAGVNVTGVGNTLLIVHESDTELADDLTEEMYDNLVGPSPSPSTPASPSTGPSPTWSPSPTSSPSPSASSPVPSGTPTS